jgi:hypothetical protein
MRIPAVLGGSAVTDAAWRRQLCPHRRHERLDADDVHDAREVVGQYVTLDEALKNTFPASDPVSVEQPTTSGARLSFLNAR